MTDRALRILIATDTFAPDVNGAALSQALKAPAFLASPANTIFVAHVSGLAIVGVFAVVDPAKMSRWLIAPVGGVQYTASVTGPAIW